MHTVFRCQPANLPGLHAGRITGTIVAALLCGAACLPTAANAQAKQARISAVLNSVAAKNGVSGKYIVGRIGVVLVRGDGVRTGPRSAAGITFDDGTVLRLGELSEVTIKPGVYHDVRLASGSVFGNFAGPGRVTGRYAVAAVRGTQILVTEEPGSTVVSDYADGPGTHMVDVARAGTQLISATITTLDGNTITSSTLVGDDEDWMGARLHLGGGPVPIQDRNVTAFDARTGSVTLDAPLTGANLVNSPFILIKPSTQFIRTLVPHEETDVPSAPGAPPSPARSTPNLTFARGMENPIFNAITPGQDVQTQLSGSIHDTIETQQFQLNDAMQTNSPTENMAPGIQTGSGAPGGIPSGFGNSSGSNPGGVTVGVPGSPGTGGVTVVVGGSPTTRAFRVNPPHFDALAYATEDDVSGLAHAEGSAVYDDFFGRIGVRGGRVAGRNELAFDEAMIHYRHKGVGDIEAGRFHWFPGPVTNTLLGKLISFYTADGVLWNLPLPGPVSVQTAYFARIDPLQGPVTSGYAARASAAVKTGHVGVTALMGSVAPGQVGFSFDASAPVIPQKLEVYGEVGRDLLQENLYTAGLYLPYFFQKYGTDIYLEYAHRDNFGGEINLSAHFPLIWHFSGLATLSKFGGHDWAPSAGILAHF